MNGRHGPAPRVAAPSADPPRAWTDVQRERHKAGPIVARYDYTDEDGVVLFQVTRHEGGPEGKTFRQWTPAPGEGWLPTISGARRVPFRLPDLLAADPAGPVFVVEGEKDALRLAGLGLVATCNAMGAGKWRREDSEPLRGRRVVILPDNDGPGQAHAEAVAAALQGIAAAVRVLKLPGLPPKGDVSDWIAAGGTAEQLLEMVTPRPRILVMPADEFCARQWPERPIIIGPMRERSIGTIFAEAGVGKSLLVHSLAVAIARGPTDDNGTPVGGLAGFGWTVPEARRVLLVDGELPAGELAERLNAWNPAEKLPRNLLICSDDASGGIPSFMTQEGRDEIEAHLDGVAVLLLDNVSTLLTGEGDANAAESWQAAQDWLLSLRRRGLLVQLVDHSGKTTGRGPRGTSRKLDIVDYAIELSHARDWQASDGCRFRLKFPKSRGVSDHRVAPRSVRLENDEHGVLRWAVRAMGDAQREEALTMLEEGASVRDVAEALEISAPTVYRWRNQVPQTTRNAWKQRSGGGS